MKKIPLIAISNRVFGTYKVGSRPFHGSTVDALLNHDLIHRVYIYVSDTHITELYEIKNK